MAEEVNHFVFESDSTEYNTCLLSELPDDHASEVPDMTLRRNLHVDPQTRWSTSADFACHQGPPTDEDKFATNDRATPTVVAMVADVDGVDYEDLPSYVMTPQSVSKHRILHYPPTVPRSMCGPESDDFITSSRSVVVSRKRRASELHAKAAFARRCAEKRKNMRDRRKEYAECEADLHMPSVKHDHTRRGSVRAALRDRHIRWLMLILNGETRRFSLDVKPLDREIFIIHFISSLFYLSGFMTSQNGAFSDILDNLSVPAKESLEVLLSKGGYLYWTIWYCYERSIMVRNRVKSIMKSHNITYDVMRKRLEYSSIFGMSNLQITALRLLLIMAGVEQNPGPAQSKMKQNNAKPNQQKGGKSPQKKLNIVRATKAGSDGGKAQMIDSINDTKDKLDAANDTIAELKSDEGCVVVVAEDGSAKLVDPHEEEIAKLKKDVSDTMAANDQLRAQLARYTDFDPFLKDENGERRVKYFTCFPGRFDGYKSTFADTDRINYVWILDDGTWKVLVPGSTFSTLQIPDQLVAMAARSCCSDDLTLRFKNIMACLRSSSESKAIIDGDPVGYGFTLTVIGFVLTGIVEKSGSTRWLNDVKEGVPRPYQVMPAAGWQNALKGVHFLPDLMKVQACMARKVRRAKYFLKWLTCYIPDWADPMTLRAGLFKRLFPVLPRRTRYFAMALRNRADELANYILRASRAIAIDMEDQMDDNERILEKALKGRNAEEAKQITEGFEAFVNDPLATTTEYLNTPYDCFFKIECYPEGSKKPPRFIMSLPPKMRGVQVAAMGRILEAIEVATAPVNVKGLTKDEIYQKMLNKFQEVPMCVETDYSSFESCISPELKSIIENRIFMALADPSNHGTIDFIHRALERPTVPVKGPGFVIPKFHHIRMSGDYWTSLGNLLTNVVVTSTIMDMDLDQFMKTWVVEGDDGAGPSPTLCGMSLTTLEERAKQCGVLLTFAEAPWQSLSFCGNHFEVWECHFYRHRDPLKTLMGLTCLYNVDPTTDTYDAMLQRSKCLSVLSDSWIRGASVFAACVEYLTRGIKVKEEVLLQHGLLKEYSSYGLESCLPGWLAACENVDSFCRRVSERDLAAGGICTKKMVRDLLYQLIRNNGAGEERIVDSPDTACVWEERDGLGEVIRKDGRRTRYVDHTKTHWYGSVSEQLGLPAAAPQTYTRHSRHRIYNHSSHQWYRRIWRLFPDRDDFWGQVRLWTALSMVGMMIHVFLYVTAAQFLNTGFACLFNFQDCVSSTHPLTDTNLSFNFSSVSSQVNQGVASYPNMSIFPALNFTLPQLGMPSLHLNFSSWTRYLPDMNFTALADAVPEVLSHVMAVVHSNALLYDLSLIALQILVCISVIIISRFLRELNSSVFSSVPFIGSVVRFISNVRHAVVEFGMWVLMVCSLMEMIIAVLGHAGWF